MTFISTLARLQPFAADRRALANGEDADLLAAQLRTEQIDMVARLTPPMMLGNLINVAVAMVAIYPNGRHLSAILWAGVLVVMTATLYVRRLLARRMPRPRKASPRGLRIVIRNGFLMGLAWAGLPGLFYLGSEAPAQILIISLSAGMLVIGGLALAAVPAASIAFITPLLLASLVSLLREGQLHSYLTAALALGCTLLLLHAIRLLHESLVAKAMGKAKAERDARHDRLTNLLNRAGFEEYIENKAVQPMKRHGVGFGVLYLDLDGFKPVNDTFGHAAGDELLKQVAERLGHAVRPEDCVARLGGDEFGIVVKDSNDATQLAAVAERILRAFNAPFYALGKPVACRTSIGIARAPMEGADAPSVLRAADSALYVAKKNAPGSYAFLESDVDEQLRRRKQIGGALAHAIAAGEFSLDYQPVFPELGGQPTAFESLLRWNNPELGPVTPGEFIPVAEELGLIQDIGEWVIPRACATLAQMPDRIRMSVNFSPLQLRSPTLVDFTLDTLAANAIAPARFEIEVTETISIEGDGEARQVLEAFRDRGISIALDDFGTGYSSLSYICSMPIDRVKIDRSFVASLGRSTQSMAVIQAILGLARNLGLQVVAEGIETRLQYDVIAGHGCQEFQGYLLSRPLPEQAAIALANGRDAELSKVA